MGCKSQTVEKTSDITEHKQSLHDLCEYLSRRFGSEAVFLVDRNKAFEAMTKVYCPDALIKDIASINDLKPQHFRNVMLMEVLENVKSSMEREILDKSWRLLKKEGFLVVIVPNEDVYNHPHQIRRLNQNKLKEILSTFGRPKLMKEQPFKWLVMYVKNQPQETRKNKTIEKRMQVTARLCRGRVVELGCGRGLLTKKIHDLGLEVVGVDKSGNKINEARHNFPDIEFIEAGILALSLPPNSFDTALLPEILEHVCENVGDKMVDIAWDFLKPGGRLIVSVPNNNCIPNQKHIRLFTRHSLCVFLSRFGKPKLATEQPYKWLMMYVDKQQ